MRLPKIPEKAVPLVILLVVVVAVLLFYNSSQPDQQPSGNNLAVLGPSTVDTASGEALVETLSGYDAQVDQALDISEKALEKKVAEFLSKVAGVGKVHVAITFETGVVRRYEQNISSTERETRETDSQGGARETLEKSSSNQAVISGNGPIISQVERAQIAGVAVVVEGGQDTQLLARVKDCVKTLLGIDPAKVTVMPMAK